MECQKENGLGLKKTTPSHWLCFKFDLRNKAYANLNWSYHLAKMAFKTSLGYEFNVLNNINEQLRSTGVVDTVNSASFVVDVARPVYLHGLVASFGVGF